MTVEPAAAHRSSHRPLLLRHMKPAGGSIDAIVVPASRPAAYLLPAMEVAAALGCQFVGLCSGRTDLEEAAELAVEVPDLSWTLVDFRRDWSSELLRFGTSEIREATESRLGDLSPKRNVGLLLARMVGWQGLLFLDDDIRDLSPTSVRKAASVLKRGRMTGMIAEDFPDNSVVCHALRLSGRSQAVFVSGSALAVDTTRIETFFPEVYNEDWLFLYDLVRRRQVAARGTVRQAPYKPFADPARAAGEEFGDVLAEGLMSLLHSGNRVERALEEEYWGHAVAQRRDLMRGIADRLATVEHRDAPAALAAVAAARAKLDTFDGAVLSMYVRRWREDLRDWRKRLDRLPVVPTVGVALTELGLVYRDDLSTGWAGSRARDDRFAPTHHASRPLGRRIAV